MLITIIGRGHSGTRAISHTLSASGVFMGSPLNESGDLLPPEAMYEACRVLGRFVRRTGEMDWDFTRLHTMDIPAKFRDLLEQYLQSVTANPAVNKGWKIPETTLVYPWILRMFPDIRYIFWVRDPRDCILGAHLTDELSDFGVPWDRPDDVRRRRAISWKYQYDLIRATPRPVHRLDVRFEDFVLDQEKTLGRIEAFLGIPLVRIPVRPDAVGRWKGDTGVHDFDFLAPAQREYGYGTPGPGAQEARHA